MEELLQQLKELGLTEEQVKKTFTITSKWVKENHPVVGAVIETILKKNRLIEYLD